MKKACIFVDGENLRHSIVELFASEFRKEEYLPKKAEWQRLFDWLAEKAGAGERVRTYWYTIQHIDFYPYNLPKSEPEKLRRLLAKHFTTLDSVEGHELQRELDRCVKEIEAERQKMQGRFDGWTTVQNGIQLKHSSLEFRRAGACRYDLFKREMGDEKAVDVKLATDLLELRSIYDVAVILTGDSDYVPAVEVIKNSGKRVVNVSFLTRNGKTLPGGAWRLNLTCDERIEIPYDELNRFLRIVQEA